MASVQTTEAWVGPALNTSFFKPFAKPSSWYVNAFIICTHWGGVGAWVVAAGVQEAEEAVVKVVVEVVQVGRVEEVVAGWDLAVAMVVV
jgi:hypothetical protein